MLKHINNRSDFCVIINFYDMDGAPRTIPTAPFRMVFSTWGGAVTYEVESTSASCRKLDPTTIAVSFDFSEHEYFQNGELIVTFFFSDKNTFFKDGRIDTRHPIRTGYVIWDGETDFTNYVNINLVSNYEKPVNQYPSYLEFPNIGNTYALYVDEAANKAYRWDAQTRRYYCVGSDYNDIDIIDSGDAEGLGKDKIQ